VFAVSASEDRSLRGGQRRERAHTEEAGAEAHAGLSRRGSVARELWKDQHQNAEEAEARGASATGGIRGGVPSAGFPRGQSPSQGCWGQQPGGSRALGGWIGRGGTHRLATGPAQAVALEAGGEARGVAAWWWEVMVLKAARDAGLPRAV